MSQWTHILGIIRFDSLSKNCWPEPWNKDALCNNEAELTQHIFSMKVPHGSEGPIEVKTILTARGPTVVLTGDLRDFGKEDIHLILEWLNERIKAYNEMWQHRHPTLIPPFLRDAIVICDVEFDNNLYLIIDKDMDEKPTTGEQFIWKK